MVELIRTLPPTRKIALGSGLVFILIVFIIGVVWLLIPKHDSLYEGLDEASALTVIELLEEKKIPFQVLNTLEGNTITVPADSIEQLRVTLSQSLGLPDVHGLELFDNADYSMTDFSQDVTYKRAIQGELARTISNMPEIQSARVHITFSPKKLFGADQQKAKASIFVEELPQLNLSQSQVAGIQKLVANSIEKLEPKNVAVFGANGVELTAQEDSNASQNIDKKYQAKYLLEQRLTEKAYKILTLFIAPEQFAVSVDVTLNFDQRKKLKQGYAADVKGEGAILKQRETSVTEEPSGDSRKSSPVLSKEKEVEFMHGQETEETVYSAGEIAKTAVGVAISATVSSVQLIKIKDVLEAGLGIDTFRGDKLAVEIINLSPEETVPSVNQITLSELAVDKPTLPQVTRPSEIQNQAKTFYENNLFDVNIWWFLLLLIFPLVWGGSRYQKVAVRKRQSLLIELQEWLDTEEMDYDKA